MRVNNVIPIFVDLGTNIDLTVDGVAPYKQIKILWWGRLEVITTGTNGNVVITIQTSFDTINWVDWNECSRLVLTEEVTHIRMSELDGLFYRLQINATDPLNTNTAGTIVTAKLFLKELL